MPPTEAELAYAAGILDGEGHIGFGYTSGYAALKVAVTNTDERLILWLIEQFGGYRWEEQKRYAPNAKLRFVWELRSRRAAEFLRMVQPYLILKAERAAIALEFQDTIQGVGKKVGPEIYAQRKVLVDRVRALNKRGVQ